MRKIVSLVLALILASTILTGCGEKKKLLGTWECTLDLSAEARQLLDAQELGEEFDVSNFFATAQLTFFEDGAFRLELDQDKLNASVDKLLADLEAGLIDLLQTQLQEMGLNVSMEELLSLSGLEMDDLTAQLQESFETERFMQELCAQVALEGFYRVKKDKLLFCADAETKLKDIYTLYTLEETKLTLTSHVGENTFLKDNLVLNAVPLEFTK